MSRIRLAIDKATPSTVAAVQEVERQLVQQEVVSGCTDLAGRIVGNEVLASASVAQVLPGLLRIGDEPIAEDRRSMGVRGMTVLRRVRPR